MSTALKPCGTTAAYQRHLRRKEVPCAECRRANREWHRENRAADPKRRAKEADYQAAYDRAKARLLDMHPDLFAALLAEERAR